MVDGCRNADAGGIGLDADAQLWKRATLHHKDPGESRNIKNYHFR
jgi:hypothetical protein